VAYDRKGQQDQAIAELTKAIEINPKDAEVYTNRAVAYYNKREYDKAWEDVRKAESLGLEVDPELLKAVRQASGRQE